MSRKKIDADVRKYATELMQEKGYISPVDLLITMDRITIRQVEDWRFKRITYLERVIIGNLTKLNYILEVLRKFAQEQKLQPSVTVYKSWGKGPKKWLQFSKTGNPYMERQYATHYVQSKKSAE